MSRISAISVTTGLDIPFATLGRRFIRTGDREDGTDWDTDCFADGILLPFLSNGARFFLSGFDSA